MSAFLRRNAMRRPLLILLLCLAPLMASASGHDAAVRNAATDNRTAARFDADMRAVAAAQAVAEPDVCDTRLDEAIAAFRSILVDEPGLVRVRLELARAFFLKGEDAFSPRLSLIREERKTNTQALDYQRNRAELSFVRQF